MRKTITTWLILILCFSSAFVLIDFTEKSMGQVVTLDGVEYTTHAPIRINSNADFTPANGVTGGSGTEADPWIIENYDINGSGENSCISIGNIYGSITGGITDYFIIRNCNLHNANAENSTGINLFYVQNGTIYDNIIYDNSEYGIYIRGSEKIIIENNEISLNDIGIYFLHDEEITVANNHLSDNGYVMSAFQSDFNVY